MIKKAIHKDSDLRRRIHMVQGQLDGVVRMLDEEKGCVEILNQLKAARAGTERVLALFLQDNLQRCVGAEGLSKQSRVDLETIIGELVK